MGSGVLSDPKLYQGRHEMAMWSPETAGRANDNLLLTHFFLSSESLRHLALLIASDVTCKLLEWQMNRRLVTP
jgi:hypothetical protein